jgi:ABC-type bacteriocin/lantibiotic exporter with double-glycine peptidase domain
MTKMQFTYRKQETDVYCGPAIVQMILSSIGMDLSQAEIAGSLGTNEATGTMIGAIQDFLRTCELDAVRKNDASWEDIRHALDDEMFVVVGYVEPEEDVPHYSLVKDLASDTIVLIDPWIGAEKALARDEFEMRWRDDAANAYGERMMMTVSTP